MLRCALVCEGAVLRAGCVVGPGSIVSYGCVVDTRHVVPPHTRISLCQQVLGAVSKGRGWGARGGEYVQ